MAKEMNQFEASNKIILRSVYGKTEQKYWIAPVKDPKTRRYPDCVKEVDDRGNLIMTDAERNSGNVFLSADEPIMVQDGKIFDLTNPVDAAEWEAIKNSFLIASDRYATDENGNSIIDGHIDRVTHMPTYGRAELYVYKPGEAAKNKVSRAKLKNTAITYIIEDSLEHQVQIARLLGKHMEHVHHADLENYLIETAERDPQKIINLYRGNDTELRIMFYEAVDRKIIEIKDGIYVYDGSINLGGTDDSSISWLKDAKNKKWLDRITEEVYPEFAKKNKSNKE
jgi:hypothetical protein